MQSKYRPHSTIYTSPKKKPQVATFNKYAIAIADPNLDKLSHIWEEEGATLEPTFPVITSFHTKMGSKFAERRLTPCMSADSKSGRLVWKEK